MPLDQFFQIRLQEGMISPIIQIGFGEVAEHIAERGQGSCALFVKLLKMPKKTRVAK
jgi:hypothetical protein